MIFVDTPANVQAAAFAQLDALRNQAHLPTFAMDYCESADLACRRTTARSLDQKGVRAFVTDPDVQTVGVGRIEVMPRKILMVQTPGDGEPIEQSQLEERQRLLQEEMQKKAEDARKKLEEAQKAAKQN